ncbi:MAG: hypothetical protein HDR26_03320 [Lachnospiraceae bacterium]|nr:hypothetical protein [Lachnospiraceae bacterium]
MSDWMSMLKDVDDDYLVGISNKGIVKRAYKDKEEIPAEITEPGGELSVRVGDETVTVRFPLGESRCSCPSRSICRHVVQAILVLREHAMQEAAGEAQKPESAGTTEKAENAGATEKAENAGTERPGSGGEPMQMKDAGETETSEGAKAPGVSGEINAYPLAQLKKAIGGRGWQAFLNRAAADIKPEIQYTSIVTVRLPEQGFVVKLLSPLGYSSCTCHKKELCAHKAEAILWCQLEAKVLNLETLMGENGEERTYDMDAVREAAGQMKDFLEELLRTGLSRTSPDALDYLERLAVISHNVGLARFEGYFRALFDSYDRYFKRKAAFRTEDLMGQITRLYRRVDLLLHAKDSAETAEYAGEFRADYMPVGNLDLIGIAIDHFHSQTGYEGETVYFLEERTRKWYTYTNARPVFYEKGRRRGMTEKSQAPWGLNISLEELVKVRIRLIGAKCDGRRRLSASQDTKGEIMGEQRLSSADVEGWYYSDFAKLFPEQIGRQQREWLSESGSQEGTDLVFVQPDSCERADFSQTGQQLSLPLYDIQGREILVEVTYSKDEAGSIRYLERISQKKPPCFLGKIYLRDGRIRMYPVAVMDKFRE